MKGSGLSLLTTAIVLLAFGGGCVTPSGAKRPSTPADWRTEMQPPLTSEESQELAEGIRLSRAITMGVERNPAAAAARERWLARIKAEPQAVTPPDPVVEAGYQVRSTETRVGPVDGSLGFRQPLPWPQKLWARGRVAATSADIARLQYEAAARDIIIGIKSAYYELYYLDQAIPVVERIETMLRRDAVLAYGELSFGRAQLNEAFRAESQAAQLAYDRILLTEQRAAQAESFKSLLNLPPETVVGPVRQAPVYGIEPRIEALQARAESYAEALNIRGLETQRAAYETLLAKLARIPDLSLGGTYTFVDEARTPAPMRMPDGRTITPPTPAMSGKDAVVGMVSMNLPIFEWRNRAMIAQQKALEKAMRLDALAELNQVRAAVAQAAFRVRLTERLVQLYDETLLPQAESIMSQAEILYRNDQASFSNLIETTLAYQNFTLARLRARADHGQAIGELERVLGTTAESRPEDSALPEGEAGGSVATEEAE